jgi:hypothetical protein
MKLSFELRALTLVMMLAIVASLLKTDWRALLVYANSL